jgi:hypothetical protein
MKSKSFFLLLCTLILINSKVSAQAHQKGDIALSPGISFGNYGFHGDGFGASLIGYADFSPHDYASVGPYFGVFISDGTAFDFGARGNFHWWQLTDDKANAALKADILDLYFSVYVGAEISNFYDSRARGGAMLGLRWYFVEPVALMFEIGGPPVGFTTIGFTFKLK